jgi:glycosyltransferase involved in cell wall biosynthesis
VTPTDHQPDSEELNRRITALEEKLDHLQALLVRAYEDTPRAANHLLEARRDPAYRSAYADEPLVTVRIGAYKGGDLLFERSLGSVRRQSYPNWEAVVVCDGADAATATRVAALDDPRITCVQRPRNGPYPSHPQDRWNVAGSHPFNHGVALAKGMWIAPIDQDDEWTADHLSVLVDRARQTGAEVVYGISQTLIGGEGETYFGSWPPTQGDFGFQAAIYHFGLAPFLYDANSYMVGEPADWNLARRMLEAGVNFDFVERIVTTYYVDPGSHSADWWMQRFHERGPFRPSPGAG